MIITLCAPRFDPAASIFLDVDQFDMSEQRINNASNALAGEVIVQDIGTRIVTNITINVRYGTKVIYDAIQYLVANHPTLELSHPSGRFIIAPISSLNVGGGINISALVVSRV